MSKKKKRDIEKAKKQTLNTLESLKQIRAKFEVQRKRVLEAPSDATKSARVKRNQQVREKAYDDVVGYFRAVYAFNSVRIQEDLEKQCITRNHRMLLKSYNKLYFTLVKNSDLILTERIIRKKYRLFFRIYSFFQSTEEYDRQFDKKEKSVFTKVIYTPMGNKR